MTSRPSTAAPILAVLAIVLGLLGAYVGAYIWVGDRENHWDTFVTPPPGQGEVIGIWRKYERQWQASIFYPASVVESKLRGIPVKASERPGIKAHHPGWGIWQDFP